MYLTTNQLCLLIKWIYLLNHTCLLFIIFNSICSLDDRSKKPIYNQNRALARSITMSNTTTAACTKFCTLFPAFHLVAATNAMCSMRSNTRLLQNKESSRIMSVIMWYNKDYNRLLLLSFLFPNDFSYSGSGLMVAGKGDGWFKEKKHTCNPTHCHTRRQAS